MTDSSEKILDDYQKSGLKNVEFLNPHKIEYTVFISEYPKTAFIFHLASLLLMAIHIYSLSKYSIIGYYKSDPTPLNQPQLDSVVTMNFTIGKIVESHEALNVSASIRRRDPTFIPSEPIPLATRIYKIKNEKVQFVETKLIYEVNPTYLSPHDEFSTYFTICNVSAVDEDFPFDTVICKFSFYANMMPFDSIKFKWQYTIHSIERVQNSITLLTIVLCLFSFIGKIQNLINMEFSTKVYAIFITLFLIAGCNPGLYLHYHYGFSKPMLYGIRVVGIALFLSFLMNEALLKSQVTPSFYLYIRLVEVSSLAIACISVLRFELSDNLSVLPNPFFYTIVVVGALIVFFICFMIVNAKNFAEERSLTLFLVLEACVAYIGMMLDFYATNFVSMIPDALKPYIFRIELFAVLFGVANIFLQPVAPSVPYAPVKESEYIPEVSDDEGLAIVEDADET